MEFTRIVTAGSLAAASVALGLFVATPAQADPETDAFVDAVTRAGLADIDPARATQVGQEVCPMLAEPGQQVADVAARVSESLGRPLGPATMFTGMAITWFCPGAVAAVANGESPIPLGLLGVFQAP